MVGSDNRPFVPELFWAVAEEWKPRWHPMPQAPPPEPPERFRLSGTLGAVSLGAPLAAGPAGGWPRLYVADDTDLATVVGAYGAPSGWTGSEIAVCPSRYGFTLPSTMSRDGFLVANGLIIALDLAQDRARGGRYSTAGTLRRLPVSGELRLANSGVAPLVVSLAALAEAVPIGEFAVIGGLAVLARLQGAHRVTYDLDTVATQHGDELTAVETVISTDGVDGLLLGTKIDCIAVGDVPASDIPANSCRRGRQTVSSYWPIVGPSTRPRTSRSLPKKVERWWPRFGAELPPQEVWWP